MKKLGFQPELINALKGYKKKFIFNDLFAGLMVALVALPLNLAMGVRQSPEGFAYALQIGLWSAIVGGLLLSIFGGTRFSIGGPTAPFITVIVILLSTPNVGMNELFFATALAGVILIIAGLLKAGKLLKFIAYPAVIGICLGIGVALLFNLLSDLGLVLAPHTELTRAIDGISPFIARLIRTGAGITSFSLSSFLIGGFAVLLVYLLPKIHKKIPALIVAIIVATGLSLIFYVSNVPILQPLTIEQQFGRPEPAWGQHLIRFGSINFGVAQIYIFAFAIALIAALEGMMSSTAVENISSIKYNADTEIIALGAANVGSGIFGGLPTTAAMARTNLNYQSGAKSNFSGIFQALFLLLFYVVLMQFMGIIPLAALTAPLVKVAIATSFYPLVARLIKFSKRDGTILAVTGIVTIIFGVHFGVIAGVAISFILNINSFKNKIEFKEHYAIDSICSNLASNLKHSNNTDVACTVERLKAYASLHNCGNNCCETSYEKVLVSELAVSGTLFFVNANKLIDKIKKMLLECEELVIDLSNVKSIDATVSERLTKLTKTVAKAGKKLTIKNANESVQKRLEFGFRRIVVNW